MTSSKKTPDKGTTSNIVSLQKGYPKRPESISPEEFKKSADDLVQFEMSYQRKQFESFTTMITNLMSLKGTGMKLRFRNKDGATSSDDTTINVVDLRTKAAAAKPERGG